MTEEILIKKRTNKLQSAKGCFDLDVIQSLWSFQPWKHYSYNNLGKMKNDSGREGIMSRNGLKSDSFYGVGS